MSASTQCPQCGRLLRMAILDGLCPACVARQSLGFARVVAIADSPIADRLMPPEPWFRQSRRIGDYEIESEIARGGMGVVYRARQLGLERPVALKLLLAGQFADPVQVRRFRAEAAAVARLEHPAIVPVYEVGEFDGRHFFSMRLIEGPSLAHAMASMALPASILKSREEGRALRPLLRARQRELAEFMAVIVRAVHYAHQRGVLHRDLKPGNILLDAMGRPHITDFGLALCLDTGARFTGPGLVFGTPAYMPPEQTVDPHNVSVGADVYSLGAITYELLTGRPPFEAGTPVETVIQVREREPIRPRDLEPDLDRDLENIVLKCLEKDPARRYATALALAEDLDRFIAGEPVLARPVRPIVRLGRWAKRRPALAALVGLFSFLVGLLAIGGPSLAILLAERNRQTEEANRQSQLQLRQALLSQAGAERLGGEGVRREKALAAVGQAAKIGKNLSVLNEAVAQLARFDISAEVRPLVQTTPGRPLVCSPDFRTYFQITGGGDVVARSATNGEVLWTRSDLKASSSGTLTVFPGSGYLALVEGAQLTVLDAREGTNVWSWPIHNLVGVDPGGRWILAQDSDRDIQRFELSTGRKLSFPPGLSGLHNEMAVAPGATNTLLARLHGRNVELFDWNSNAVVATLAHSSPMMLIIWEEHRIAVYDNSDTIAVWRLPSRHPVIMRERIPKVVRLQFIPGTPILMAVTKERQTYFFDADEGERVLVMNGWTPDQVSDDGTQVLQVSGDGVAIGTILHPAGRVRFRFEDGEDPQVRQVTFSPDSRFLAVVKQAGVHLMDLGAHQEPAFIPQFGAVAAFFVPRTNLLVVQGRRSLVWYEVIPTGGVPRARAVRTNAWEEDAWTEPGTASARENRLVIPHSKRGLEFLRLSDGERIGGIPSKSVPWGGTAARAGDWIVCQGPVTTPAVLLREDDGKLPLVDFERGVVPRFSPDGSLLLVSSRTDHRVYSVTNWTEVRHAAVLAGSRRFPSPAAWATDSRVAALFNDLGELVIRNVPKAEDIVRLTTPNATEFTALDLSPGGRWLAAGSDRGSVELWDLTAMDRALEPLGLTLDLSFSRGELSRDALAWGFQRNVLCLPVPEPEGIQARDPSAGPRQLDLTRFYNARLDKSWTLLDPDTTQDSLVQFEAGLRTFDGIPFDARGVIQLSGERFENQPGKFESRIQGIPVGMPVARVHLLGAAVDAFSSVGMGTTVCWVRLHFRDGSCLDLPVGFMTHLADHMVPAVPGARGKFTPVQARIVWKGMNRGAELDSPAKFEVLYHVNLENPFPDRAVDSLDLISTGGVVSPFFVAISVE